MHTKSFFIGTLFFLGSIFPVFGQKAPQAYGPVPIENQLRWQEMEYYAFIHFSINTYTDMAWGKGDEDPKLFNPTDLDCRKWARICKEAGMKGIISTAKHHSGLAIKIYRLLHQKQSLAQRPGRYRAGIGGCL